MHFFRPVFLLICLVGVAPIESHADEPELGSQEFAILGGSATLGDPAVGLLRIPNAGNSLCSLTLIHPRFVVTARHCIQASVGGQLSEDGLLYLPEELRVYFGAEPSVSDFWYAVDDYRFHTAADLAVLKLSEEVHNVEPIPLNFYSLGAMIGAEVRIVGYGRTETDSGSTAGTKRFGFSRLERVTAINTVGAVAVTGAPGDGARLCAGDSGGPTFITVDGVEYLAGVNSAVVRFNSAGASAISERVRCEDDDARNAEVRVDRYDDWINGAIKELNGGSFFLTSGCDMSQNGLSLVPSLLVVLFLFRRRRGFSP